MSFSFNSADIRNIWFYEPDVALLLTACENTKVYYQNARATHPRVQMLKSKKRIALQKKWYNIRPWHTQSIDRREKENSKARGRE